MSDQSRFDRGLALLEETYGKQAVERTRERLRSLSPAFERRIIEFVYGDVQAESVLDRKTRILCNVAALTVLGRPEQLKVHIAGAMQAGASKEEIQDVMLQMAVFAGFPAAWDGLAVAHAFWERHS